MSFFRSVFLIILISLLAALGLLFFGSTMGYEEFRGGYAVLTTDVSVEDRTLRSLLDAGREYFGGDPVSESSQWVMLDVFDSLQKIPLDEYHSRVFYFDPRNDGYADKLRDVFIRDGERFVYIPLKAGSWNSGFLNKQFNDLLADIPFSVYYYGVDRPLFLFFISYAAASLCLLVICFLKRKQNRKAVCIIALIPVFSSLAFFGAAGIGCAALLFALFILLKEPLNDLKTDTFSKRNTFGLKKKFKEIIFPYRFYFLFLPFFLAAFSVMVIFSQLKLLFLIAVFAVAAAVFFLSHKILSVSHREHRRFYPVLIMKRRFSEFTFSVYMLPFIAAAFFVIFFEPYMPSAFNSNRQFDNFIDEQDYYAHLNYQASFSRRQLGSSSTAFPGFFIDADGLPAMEINPYVSQTVNVNDFPPFPLKHLMDFFHDVNSGQRIDSVPGATGITERLALLVLLPFILPLLFIKKGKKPSPKASLDSLKRVSKKLRFMGINWNKKSLYNDRKMQRIQKDA